MITILAPAPSHKGRNVVIRCECGVEKVVAARRVPHMRSCGCAPKRRPRVKVAMEIVPRLVPVSWRRSDAATIGAFYLATGVEPHRLAWLHPMDVEAFLRLAGLTRDDLDRAVWARWIRSTVDGLIYGVGCAASDVFGAAEVVEIDALSEAA